MLWTLEISGKNWSEEQAVKLQEAPVKADKLTSWPVGQVGKFKTITDSLTKVKSRDASASENLFKSEEKLNF